MRKIDVLLLSALILYDYGAQTMVDRDIISMGNKVITSTSNFLESDQNEFTVPESVEGYSLMEDEKGFMNLNATDEVKVKNIHYYELAKVNTTSAASSVSQENELTGVYINVPDYAAEEMMAAPAESLSETQAEENASTFALVTVASTSAESMSDMNPLEVMGEVDGGNLQFADSDGDGLYNYEDQCPGLAGVARFEGCPVPDSDGDGINDEEDHCPMVRGTADNSGCPVMENIEDNAGQADYTISQTEDANDFTEVQFELIGSDILSNDDFNVLVQLADKTIHNNNSKIILQHMDNSEAVKQLKTVVTYLTDLGVNNNQIEVVVKNEKAADENDVLQAQLHY